MPGKCLAEKKNRHHRRGSFADCLLRIDTRIDTTAKVIHVETNMRACPQLAPKGSRHDHWTNSLVAMFTDNQVGGHCNWNQP